MKRRLKENIIEESLKSIRNSTAHAIKLIRNFHYKTQKEMAKDVDISSPVLSAYESGRSEPSLDNLEKIVKRAGLKLSEFFLLVEIIQTKKKDFFKSIMPLSYHYKKLSNFLK